MFIRFFYQFKLSFLQLILSLLTCLIKLDLSHYDASHQVLLSQWDILGPPTYLFLNPQQQEIRSLRLTGAFQKMELLQQLSLFKGKQ